jgi:hypothetical protein
MGRAFFADDPGLIRTLTDAGICCALFACSYPFSSCGLCVSVMQVAGWQQKREWALRWANASPQEKAEFEERVRLVEVALSDWQPPQERVRQVEVAMSDWQPPQVESLQPLSESQPAGEIFCIDLNTDLFIHSCCPFIHSFIHSCSPFTSFMLLIHSCNWRQDLTRGEQSKAKSTVDTIVGHAFRLLVHSLLFCSFIHYYSVSSPSFILIITLMNHHVQ